jgi:hypothetical protein
MMMLTNVADKSRPTRFKEKIKTLVNHIFRLEEINGVDRCPTYLYRWTLLSMPWFKIYLHHFVAEDWSLDLHDHPKRFVTIGLRGGYIEQTPAKGGKLFWYQYWKAPWIRSFPASHVHRIKLADREECWTLCIVFKAVRQWGFWPDGRWIHWREYVGSKRADRMKSCVSDED